MCENSAPAYWSVPGRVTRSPHLIASPANNLATIPSRSMTMRRTRLAGMLLISLDGLRYAGDEVSVVAPSRSEQWMSILVVQKHQRPAAYAKADAQPTA